jgi:hypothetical protein
MQRSVTEQRLNQTVRCLVVFFHSPDILYDALQQFKSPFS